MEIVSMPKKASSLETQPKEKSVAITPEAVSKVQSIGKAEYEKVMNALFAFVGAMADTVLFREINGVMGEQIVESLKLQYSLLDPSLPLDNKSPGFTEQVKKVQRKLFLEYAKKYHVKGIEEEI